MTTEIGQLGFADATAFDRVAEGIFDHAIDHACLAACLATPGHFFIAAFADGVLVGQHAAARLLETAFALGRELGCIEAWVGTEPDNLPAQMLCQRRSQPAEPFTMYVFKLRSDSRAVAMLVPAGRIVLYVAGPANSSRLPSGSRTMKVRAPHGSCFSGWKMSTPAD